MRRASPRTSARSNCEGVVSHLDRWRASWLPPPNVLGVERQYACPLSAWMAGFSLPILARSLGRSLSMER